MMKFSDYSVCVVFHGNETIDRLKYMGYVPDMGLEVYGSFVSYGEGTSYE